MKKTLITLLFVFLTAAFLSGDYYNRNRKYDSRAYYNNHRVHREGYSKRYYRNLRKIDRYQERISRIKRRMDRSYTRSRKYRRLRREVRHLKHEIRELRRINRRIRNKYRRKYYR